MFPFWPSSLPKTMTVSRETITLSFPDFLERFARALERNGTPDSSGLQGLSLPCLTFYLLSRKAAASRTLVVIADDTHTAEDLYRAGYNLADDVHTFPERTDPDQDVPGFNQEVERYQSAALSLLEAGKPGLIITTRPALATPVTDPGSLPFPGCTLRVGETFDRQRLIAGLNSWGYEPVDRTTHPKTFSVRGGIVDVFLLYSRYPLRLEFFGNTVDSIRTFNPISQRTVKEIPQVELLPPPITETNGNHQIPLRQLLDELNPFYHVRRNGDTYSVLCSDTESNPVTPTDLNCRGWDFQGLDRQQRLDAVATVLQRFPADRVYIFVENVDQRKFLPASLRDRGTLVEGILERGFYSEKLQICCLSASEVLRQVPADRHRWSLDALPYQPQRTLTAIDDLEWGDYLVHQDYGIGLYRGLETVAPKGNQQECIKIEYADGGVVYVPVDKFHRVHKLISTGDGTPKISTLGTGRWDQQKRRVKNAARTIVRDIVNLYNARNRPRGFRYEPNEELYDALVASFPYDETPDQARAIQDVLRDMERDRPMERLICGDVGFGKTEVALRAIIKAVVSGKKVLFLTPTTILADQHYISATTRLEPLGVRVELLSRFRTKAQQQAILERMAAGTVDVVIGTHRLLSEDVRFPGLGLLIIDEEHRFGVRHKEKLKALKTEVDVLTLTATPIPRTLQQALLGLRDISKIDTPPKTRKPIQTFIKYFDWSLVQRVIEQELRRGGQVYFLHNDIHSMPFYLEQLRRRLPGRAVAMAHGRMRSKQLEEIVLAFFHGDIDVLVCTTIIESGLDVTNANTILINRAYQFGLAQMYQIRGRVGRGHRQAYCYLLLPRGRRLEKEAYLRLKTIEQYTSLGSGYDIALKDLEIRGAGSLFGYQQSGHIAAVGFEMYCRLLQEAVDEITGKPAPETAPRVTVAAQALLDNRYVPLVQDRLYFYQRLSAATDVNDVDDIREELRDRFGPLPPAADHLITAARHRVALTGSAVAELHIARDSVNVTLRDARPYPTVTDLMKALDQRLVSTVGKYRFVASKNGRLTLTVPVARLEQAFQTASALTELFSVSGSS
jgi:transcription-repair coupling factor